ncbi:ATP-dependent sacrificial sulfur transferase LarE [Planctomyces sp. SH-PL62]|uniref:ATP-dependent sacrificial sulfur transferase LarE n=1 Tax=Planctomyces sp. SH-PL62 TaxID=1636152 RepID=UPI00078CD1E7|nr:ATP-dependent sacrificial sulfur transferase LarE [Planctomyces sp. SH-PL62]AMV40796.1 tRNA-specific 2-thiouridylase MnmA [Planctomyces sp. SH-PL62]
MSLKTSTSPEDGPVTTESGLDADLIARRDALIDTIRSYGRVAVAYSGGVDSAVVARAAYEALGDAAIAVTAVSESLASGELEEAQALAKRIGIRHRAIHTKEFADPNYLRNNPDRCYFCKSELYGRLSSLMDQFEVDAIASGANLDDRGDHRPGMRAAGEKGVRHPLQECGLGKADVRALAQSWGLPVWDKPAAPCLSSRIAYGEEVSPERVRMVDQAESWLRARGLRLLRVRYHKGDMARVEVAPEEFPKLTSDPVRSELTAAFRGFGFKFVALDLDGFRSGSLNDLIPLEQLLKPRATGG